MCLDLICVENLLDICEMDERLAARINLVSMFGSGRCRIILARDFNPTLGSGSCRIRLIQDFNAALVSSSWRRVSSVCTKMVRGGLRRVSGNGRVTYRLRADGRTALMN